MKSTSSLLLALAALALGSAPAPASPGKLEAVIARHLQAQGGAERLKGLKSLSYTATETFDGKTATVTVTRARPNLMRFEHSDGTMTTIKAFDGQSGWFSKDGAVQAIAADKVAGLRAHAAFDDALVDPAARGAKVELVDKVVEGGAPAYLIRVTMPDGAEELRTIDATSNLEVKRVVTFTYDGTKRQKTIAFRDYRPVNGIMTSFAQDFERDGKRGTTTISKLEYDAPVPLALFAMPQPARASAK